MSPQPRAACLSLLATITLIPVLASSQGGPPVKVRTVTDTLIGGVGGVAVDRLGVIYSADFGDKVYKVYPDGRASVFATGLYGSSGNVIDSRGHLMQSSFNGNSISRIDRDGNVELFAEGLNGPVGIAIDSADNLTVVNCRGNSVSRITVGGTVSALANSPLLNCPNGITRGPNGDYFVVNFGDGKMLRVTDSGSVSEFATIPGGGNGHVAFARGSFFVTAFQTHQLWRVSLDGTVTHVAGAPQPGEVDAPGDSARFTFPNGIAAGPAGDRLYINDFINRSPPTAEVRPIPRSVIRQVTLPAFWQLLAQELRAGGIPAMEAKYRAWKADPATARNFTEIEVNGLGYSLMNGGNIPAAQALFKLNTESYPNSFNSWDSYAESFMKAGDNPQAIRYYRKSLQINPANTNATTQLASLGAN